MEKKDKKSSRKTGRTQTKSAKGGAASKKAVAVKSETEADSTASDRFVKDLLVRGEAATPDAEGNLPTEATHAVIKENEDGTVEVKRARYKYN